MAPRLVSIIHLEACFCCDAVFKRKADGGEVCNVTVLVLRRCRITPGGGGLKEIFAGAGSDSFSFGVFSAPPRVSHSGVRVERRAPRWTGMRRKRRRASPQSLLTHQTPSAFQSAALKILSSSTRRKLQEHELVRRANPPPARSAAPRTEFCPGSGMDQAVREHAHFWDTKLSRYSASGKAELRPPGGEAPSPDASSSCCYDPPPNRTSCKVKWLKGCGGALWMKTEIQRGNWRLTRSDQGHVSPPPLPGVDLVSVFIQPPELRGVSGGA